MITISKKDIINYKGDCLAILVPQTKRVPRLDKVLFAYLQPAWDAGDFKAESGESLLVYCPDMACKRLLFVGMGEKVDREGVRLAGGNIASALKKKKIRKVGLGWVGLKISDRDMGECLIEGLTLGGYRFEKYKNKTKKSDNYKQVNTPKLSISLFPSQDHSGCRQGGYLAQVAAKAANRARDMANEPGNKWTPEDFSLRGKSLGQQQLKCTVLKEQDMKRLQMGGILGVNQGSAQPPRLIILAYNCPDKQAETLLLVGKGLTFDSGGISLKPSTGMEDMKYDMCGGAAVLAAMEAVADEQPAHVNVVAIVPATENLPSSKALKPGDVITIYGGKTVEVINTDAEGRLILADALAYGIKKYKPTAVVDMATLTGAVIFGLGHHRAGLLSNDDGLAAKVEQAAEYSGEPVWRLPLGEEYSKQLKSQVADLKNIGGKPAGTITAAAFLQEFVGETPWVHLDIAGTAWGFTEKSYIPAKGPSGFGARLLLALIRNW